jgi:hypothetical protein
VREPRQIPDDVRRFVLTSVPSVPYAEAVLLLRRRGGQPMAPEEVARALYVGDRQAAELLRLGQETGLLQLDAAGYRYQPGNEQLARAWDRFAHCYATDLIGVTQLIHGATHKSAQLFADAFKLRREP